MVFIKVKVDTIRRYATCEFLDFLNFFIFFELFIYYFFFEFFKKKSKNCHVSSCHRASWQWQSDVAVIVTRVSIMPCVISLVSIWSFILICFNSVPIFVKMSNFVLFKLKQKLILYKCYTNIFIKFDIFIIYF